MKIDVLEHKRKQNLKKNQIKYFCVFLFVGL